MTRPDLLRSWVSDILGGFEPDYVWHDLAQIWQIPGDGDRNLEQLFSGSAADRAARMTEFGIPEPANKEVAAGQNEQMVRAMLSLYRSRPGLAEIGRDLPAAADRPGLAIIATEDHFVGTLEQKHRAAKRANARVEVFKGLSHWWMLQDPARGARALDNFWATLK